MGNLICIFVGLREPFGQVKVNRLLTTPIFCITKIDVTEHVDQTPGLENWTKTFLSSILLFYIIFIN